MVARRAGVSDPSSVAPARRENEQAFQPARRRSFWRELPVLVIIAFAVALLIKSFLVQAFFIPSASMEPTLKVGDRVIVEKVSYWFSDPGRGDVVVFKRGVAGVPGQQGGDSVFTDIGNAFRGLFGLPTGGSQDFIKRVVAVEGDTVSSDGDGVVVNGEEVEEPYLIDGVQTSSFGPITVPDDTIFVMGDNRTNSDDSRNFGPIPESSVVGHAFVLIWPPNDFGGL
jgi:signal peptidase I